MKKIFLSLGMILCLTLSTLAQKNSKAFYLLVGTYTAKTSKGLYVYKFDTQTGDLKYISEASGVKNPSFLTISKDKKSVYSVGETDGGGAVNSFAFNASTGQIALKNTQSAGGAGPCHITIDKTNKWVIVGNYGAGSLSILPVLPDGSLGSATQTIQHTGSSINTERQNAPHVHSINIAPNNKDVFVPDLGTDKIFTYRLNALDGSLTPGNPPFTAVIPGSGPRHFTFHPKGRFAYVIEELSATVTAFHYTAGKLKAFQTINTLPADYTGRKWCADIHISPDGKFLYASNRAHESITVYAINPRTGELTWVDNTSVEGKTPRNFMIDPTGKYVLVANQDSDNINVFKRDASTGKLTFTGKSATVSMPVCLKAVE